ncbi:MAG: hypothetical protein KAG10_05935 [Methylococcales bacterium]|nr:hypothetical protein [Methylococcales bacterium]
MDKNLQKHLVSLAKEDQELLEKLSKLGDLANYKDEVHPKLKIVFERNTREAKEVIKKHGWPKISLVGEVGADAIYHIVQHSVLDEAFMQSCVPLLEERVKQHEAKGYQLAFLQDRTLMQQKKPQIYGTQHIEDNDGKIVPYLIDTPNSVDERRLALGLERLKERTAFLQKNHEDILKVNKKNNKEQ